MKLASTQSRWLTSRLIVGMPTATICPGWTFAVWLVSPSTGARTVVRRRSSVALSRAASAASTSGWRSIGPAGDPASIAAALA